MDGGGPLDKGENEGGPFGGGPLNSGAVLVADVYLRSGRPGGPAFGVRVGGCTN